MVGAIGGMPMPGCRALRRAGRVEAAAQIDGARACAARAHLTGRGLHALARLHAGVLEVVEDRRALLFRHGGDEPHHQEERHHRGDEVRVRHFPGAAVMSGAALLVALDDDDRALIALAGHATRLLRGLTRPSRRRACPSVAPRAH